MARTPTPTAAPPPDPMAGGMMGDPGAANGAGGDADADTDDQVVCTIAKDGQGGYVVFAGDEPEGGGAGDTDDGSEDDADAMGAAGGGPAGPAMGGPPGGGNGAAPQGQPAASIGAALKLALDILNEDASSAGGPGSSDDQFAAGYSGDQSPTPATAPRGRG